MRPRKQALTLVVERDFLVGAARFELATPSPPDWCANRAALRSDARKAVIIGVFSTYSVQTEIAIAENRGRKLPKSAYRVPKNPRSQFYIRSYPCHAPFPVRCPRRPVAGTVKSLAPDSVSAYGSRTNQSRAGRMACREDSAVVIPDRGDSLSGYRLRRCYVVVVWNRFDA